MNDIQKLIEEERKQSQLHKLSSTKINTILANIEKGNDKEFRKKLSQSKQGKKRPDMLGENNIGKTKKERLRRSKLMKGVPKTQTQIENYKKAYKQLPMLVCPHCNMNSQNQGNMNRYHFDNCKHK